jgi:hypothetical protein
MFAASISYALANYTVTGVTTLIPADRAHLDDFAVISGWNLAVQGLIDGFEEVTMM